MKKIISVEYKYQHKLNLSHKDALSESKKHPCNNLKCWKRIPNEAFNQTVGVFSTLYHFSSVEVTQVSTRVNLSSHSREL